MTAIEQHLTDRGFVSMDRKKKKAMEVFVAQVRGFDGTNWATNKALYK